MKAIVICPDRRAEVAFLARKLPLVLVPVLGPSLIEHWLVHLAGAGVKAVILLAPDRPEQVRAAVGDGGRWGLNVEVVAQAREATPAEARARWPESTIVLADRLPAAPDVPLFESAAGFFSALQQWHPLAAPQRLGVRELQSGVWAGLRCRVDPSATLIAPCWLGQNVWVGARARVGPDAYIEDSALVDHEAEVARSWIGPWTYVGALTQVTESLAWADGLQNHRSGSFTEITDAFLLGDLRGEHGFRRSSPWYGRVAALLALVLTCPLVGVAFLRHAGSGRPLFERRRATVPTAVVGTRNLREMVYRELNGLGGLGRRWPQLWNIVRGEFTWVGNRPLEPAQAARLETEFEQLWLSAPVGLVSLADAMGCREEFSEEAQVHSGFYAVRSGPRLDRALLRWLFTPLPKHRLNFNLRKCT